MIVNLGYKSRFPNVELKAPVSCPKFINLRLNLRLDKGLGWGGLCDGEDRRKEKARGRQQGLPVFWRLMCNNPNRYKVMLKDTLCVCCSNEQQMEVEEIKNSDSF